MDRKTALTVAIVASFFLFFLGIRTPTLHDGQKPKPAQRAVIEKSAKSLTAVCQSMDDDAEACAKFAVTTTLFSFPLTRSEAVPFPATDASRTLARAPPANPLPDALS